ncbi:MAG: hypothetical protein ABSD20_07080 [Terriglobales bacterium]
MKRRALSLAAILLFSGVLAFSQDDKPNWDAWKMVMGDWTGTGSGNPGEGSGSFSFKPDLQGSVLVRRNHTEYPASGGRPATLHEDLMVVYAEHGHVRAVYFDNEGHVINYTPSFSPDGKTLTLVSDPAPNAPTFRLSYVSTAPDVLKVNFEIAAPGTSAFKSYLGGLVHRTK